jgi:predicted methyltransferase
MRTSCIHAAILILITACSSSDSPDAAAVTTTNAVDESVYRLAVDNPQRSEQDRARDAGRKPAEVLKFLGIRPGMTVLDLYSGGGYYTELLSYVVGDSGKVVAHSNEAYLRFSGDESRPRYADKRLPNVEILMAENNRLSLPAGHFDAIAMILAYHDIYFASPNDGWPKIDGPKLLAELYSAAKPGEIFGIVDHYAEAGSPRETGGTTHRIDPGIVIAEVQAAGFVLEDKSDVLRNMDDDYSRNVFEADLRGKTDRFVLRFRKPQ